MTTIHDLPTPALVVDAAILEANLSAMAEARPGSTLRPHVKAFKSTRLAAEMASRHGHKAFCCATLKEMEGMAHAGLGDDLLLANQTLDIDRLTSIAADPRSRITVAVDSIETIEVAAKAGVREVLIDIDVGLPRCGCKPDDAVALAGAAIERGLEVRGVMGYEGHCQDWVDLGKRTAEVHKSMSILAAVHAEIGGDVISAGGTGTHAINDAATEIQAGSHALMDTHYAELADLPFGPLRVLTTVISVRPGEGGWYVADAGLKAFGMDHGNPDADSGDVFFCSDEHTTVLTKTDSRVRVGHRVTFVPAHVDPTVAKHPLLHIIDGEEVIDTWPVNLRHW